MFKQFLFLIGLSICAIACNNQAPADASNTPPPTIDTVEEKPITEPPATSSPTYDFMHFVNQDAFEFVNDEKVIECVTNLMGQEKADAILMNMGGAEGEVEFLKNDGNMCFVATSSIVHEDVAYDAILAVTVDGDEVWAATTDESGNLGVTFPDNIRSTAPKPVKDFLEMYK